MSTKPEPMLPDPSARPTRTPPWVWFAVCWGVPAFCFGLGSLLSWLSDWTSDEVAGTVLLAAIILPLPFVAWWASRR